MEEIKKVTIMAGVVIEEKRLTEPIEWSIEKIGSWSKLVRRTAWSLRFMDYKRQARPPSDVDGKTRVVISKDGQTEEIQVNCLRAEEIKNAEWWIIRNIQREIYPETYLTLSTLRKVNVKSKIFKLKPFWEP